MVLETAAIQLLLTPGLGSRTFARLVAEAGAAGVALDEMVHFSPQELVARMGLRLGVAEAVADSRLEAERTFRTMTDKGIQVLVRSHCGYPARLTELLGEDAPPVLYAAGSLSILDKCSIGIGGSRMASEGGIRLTDKVARGLTRSDINVVSGNAAGVDSAAHFAALDSGGTTTLVLAEGILNFRPKSPIGESLSDGNYVVVSEFLPGTRWAAHNAMQRNRTILGLSACFVAVEPGIDGGTFDASTNALRLGLPLFVLENDGVSANAPGTQHFLSRGAIAIRPGPDGDVDVGTLVSIARRPPETPQPMEAGLLFPGAVKPRARKRA